MARSFVFPPIVLRFFVGNTERHDVICGWDHKWGNFAVTVNGLLVVHDSNVLTTQMQQNYIFWVGQNERHHVQVQRTRPVLLPAFRKHSFAAFVNGQLVAQTP
ncbi:MAG: hypothetical protein FWD18_05490 [Micrococcales bacterium]|nr:hypothetical protein [Micrococcales bacterium]